MGEHAKCITMTSLNLFELFFFIILAFGVSVFLPQRFIIFLNGSHEYVFRA